MAEIVMWYVSGNRDEEAIENPKDFIIGRAKPHTNLSFGFGVPRWVGNHLAEMQLRIFWKELLRRLPRPAQIKVLGEPTRVPSPFMKGDESMSVGIDP